MDNLEATSTTIPVIAITMGDPAGVGPELSLQVVKEHANTNDRQNNAYTPVIFGDATVLQKLAQLQNIDLTATRIMSLSAWQTTIERPRQPTIVDMEAIRLNQFTPGQINAFTGAASYAYIETAIDQALCHRVDAIVTCPINKAALNLAGVQYPGHTEILADRTESDRYCMMLTSESITCSLVTTHIGLRRVAEELSTDRIVQAIELSHQVLKQLRGREPRLAVCGLNPHAGEEGLFGNREEETIIQPAIDRARKSGIENIIGPLPPDTAFIPSVRDTIDGYICMYHDQGLIPLKALAFDTAVNVTLGLPIVRTSVDHGTALDIAWQGRVKTSSTFHALRMAVELSRPH